MTLAILLILAGLLIIVAEVIFIPGTSIVGFVGAICSIIGVVTIYTNVGATAGHIATGSTIAILGILFFLALRYNVWSKLALKDKIDAKFNDHLLDGLQAGDTGITVSALRPVGKALINDKEYEVLTHGGYLNEGLPVRITQIIQLKIFVEPLTS